MRKPGGSHRNCCSLLLWLLFFQQCITTTSYSIKSGYFDFRGHPIHYEVASKSSTATGKGELPKAPILLLNGFGVGSFHQHKLIHELMKDESVASDRRVYCLDYLGQGRSWPVDCQDGRGAAERGLAYSGDTWLRQIVAFLEAVVLPTETSEMDPDAAATQTRVHVVGNSLGGHLAVCLAAHRPDLVESLGLLNATPVWGLNLPGWSGHLPAPEFCRRLGRQAFDWIRDYNTIRQYLKVAYHNDCAVDEKLIQQIRSCTEGDGGHAAFASILWSPPVRVALPGRSKDDLATFDECLAAVACDVLLLFGRDDPWCKPAFARRMLRDLAKREADGGTAVQRYMELANVGHCPNHEAPVAVAAVLGRWLATEQRQLEDPLAAFANGLVIQERWGKTVIRERKEDEIPLSFADRLATAMI